MVIVVNYKKQIILLMISILIVVAATVGVTFAYLSVGSVQTTANTISTTCFATTYTESNRINITSYPMSTTKGLSLTPYTFTIKNTCNASSTYQVILNVKNTTSSALLTHMNYSLDGTNSNVISNATRITLPTGATSSSVSASYLLATGTLAQINSTASHSIRFWVGDYGGNSLMGSKFEAEIMVYTVAAPSTSPTIKNATLTNLITDASFEESNWAANGTPDTTYAKYGNKSLKITGNTSAREVTVPNKTNISLNSSHKYYARYEIYHTGATGSAGLYWPIAEPYMFEGQSLGSANQWNIVGNVNNRSSFTSTTSGQLRVDFNNNNAAGTVWYDGVMLIDLTAAFGAGNEPSTAWCNSNIPFFTGSRRISYTSTS